MESHICFPCAGYKNLMFKKGTSATDDELETIIGPSVKLEGKFSSNGDVTVDGMVTGSIATTKNLRIGAGAVIQASIVAANAIVAGTVTGNLHIEGKLEILNTGQVNGDVICKSIIIQEGAVLNGTWKMSSKNATAPIKDQSSDND